MPCGSAHVTAHLWIVASDPDIEQKVLIVNLKNRRKAVMMRNASTECVKVNSTSPENSGDTQSFDLGPSGEEALAMRITRRELEDIAMVNIEEPGGEHENFLAQRGKSGSLPGSGQTESSEPVDEIVGQQNEFEMNRVGGKACGGDFAQRQTVFEFSDIQFGHRSLDVEPINSGGRQG